MYLKNKKQLSGTATLYKEIIMISSSSIVCFSCKSGRNSSSSSSSIQEVSLVAFWTENTNSTIITSYFCATYGFWSQSTLHCFYTNSFWKFWLFIKAFLDKVVYSVAQQPVHNLISCCCKVKKTLDMQQCSERKKSAPEQVQSMSTMPSNQCCYVETCASSIPEKRFIRNGKRSKGKSQ